MGKVSAIIGIAALAGIGFYVGKKIIDKRNAEEEERAQHIYEDDSELFVEEKHSTPKEKLQRASMFAVGAIKTGTEKFKEGIDDIINKDMVTKGQETFEQTKAAAGEAKDKAVAFAKTTGDNIKNGIEEIKNKVAKKSDEEGVDAEEIAEAIEKNVDEITEKPVDMADAIDDAAQPIVERIENAVQDAADEAIQEVKDEVAAAADDINNISVGSDSVETFDFSNPEEL